MTTYYELHITMTGDPSVCERAVKSLRGWRYSRIDGDVNLGDGVKSYATKQFPDELPDAMMVTLLTETAAILGCVPGIEIVRRKVERVLYDDRSSKVRAACDGACPECHTDDLGGKAFREFVSALELEIHSTTDRNTSAALRRELNHFLAAQDRDPVTLERT